MIKKGTNIFFLVLIAATVVIMQGCKDKNKDATPSTPSADSYDRTALLTNYANGYIIPAYKNYKVQCDSLKLVVDSFNAAPNTTTLQNLKLQWEKTLLVWQDVAFLEFGPAANLALRAQTNVYPVDTTQVKANIADGNANLQLSSNFDAKGFQAVDYLISGIKSNSASIVTYYTDSVKVSNYLTTVVTELQNNAATVYSEWNTTYVTNFINNSASNAQGSAVSNVVNALNKHYETYIRKGKIGLPAGVFNGFSQVAMPDHVEAYYYMQSLPFTNRSVNAIEKFIKGEAYAATTNGVGLDDYLAHVQATSSGVALETAILNQIDAIQLKLGTINDPLSNEVSTNNQGVRDVYQELQKLVGKLKIEMTDALDVMITYQDSDGD